MGFECYRIGDLVLDAGTQEVSRDGVIVQVPRLSFKLLLSLARHAPNVVSAEQLETEVWSGLVVDRGTVNKRVLLLRRSLSEDSGDPYIAVVRGSGYRLVVDVERLESCPGEQDGKDAGPPRWYQQYSSQLGKLAYAVLAAAVLLSFYLGYRDVVSGRDQAIAVEQTAAELLSPPAVYSQKAIAVLPFVDLSDDQTYQYLGDGIAEEVINLLVNMDGLEVAARTSSFAIRNAPSTALDIARKLHVGTILEGSIRHSDGQIRVTSQLIDAQSGYHIWSQTYDSSLGEVFAVQDDIAFNIALSLKLTMSETGQPDSGLSMTGDIEAFKLYLKGREMLNDRIHLRVEGLKGALEYFNQAIEIDPRFARAHAGIATVHWLLVSYDDSLDAEEHFELAETSANFALEFDPASVDALSALASVSAKRSDFKQAARLFDQIRGLAGGNDPNIISWESQLHARLGYFREMIGPLTDVYRRDPLNEHVAWSLASILVFSGRPVEAAEILRDLEHFTYRDYCLGLAAIYAGNFEAARELLRDVQMRAGKLPAYYADIIVDALEDPERFQDTAEQIMAAHLDGKLSRLVSFESLLVLGSPLAFELGFESVRDISKVQIQTQVWNNWSVRLRQDERFKHWARSSGYVDFWREFGWPDRCKPTGLDDFECI